MTTSTHKVRASRTATPVLVPAIEPAPGLRIYEQPEELRKSTEDTYVWRIGHHSGLSIAKFETRRHAEAAAELIAPIADWTREADDLVADTDLCERSQVLIVYGTAGKFLRSAA